MCSSFRVCRDSVGEKIRQFFTGSGRRTFYVRHSHGFFCSLLVAMSNSFAGKGFVYLVRRALACHSRRTCASEMQ